MTHIVQRMVLRDLSDGTCHRVIDVDRGLNRVWLCRIDDDSWPYPITHEAASNSDFFEEEPNDPYYRVHVGLDSSKKSKKSKEKSSADLVQDARWRLIEPLVSAENERALLNRDRRKELVRRRIAEAGGNRQIFTRLLLLYWKRGMNFMAVRPDFDKCGGRGQRRNATTKKIGRPRTIATGIGININAGMRKVMQIAADFYLSEKLGTLTKAIDYICRLHLKVVSNNSNEGIDDAEPTERQLRYFIEKEFPWSVRRRRRQGQKVWDLQERAITGSADGDVRGPGDLFLVDATVADFYLVSCFDRRRIVGRPIIYFVMDAFSRLIVGVYVGFEGPSWAGAMMALVNMVTPKVGFCREHGIEIDPEEWPAHYAPKRLGADRGELASIRLGVSIPLLGIAIENAPPGRAELKALVERRFGVVPAKFGPFVSGWVKQDFGERGAPDYRLEARWNLREFTAAVIRAVLQHNREPIQGKEPIPEMVTEGLEPSPINLWNWGVANRSGFLKTISIDEMSLAVMPREKARVTAKGIRFKGGFYSCETALRDEWFARARSKEWDVEFAFDPRNLGIAYVLDDRLPNGFEICRLLRSSQKREGASLYEVEEVTIANKKLVAKNKPKHRRERIADDSELARIGAEAKKAAKAVIDPDIPKTQRTKAIRKNRAEEKELHRLHEAFDLSGAPDLASPPADRGGEPRRPKRTKATVKSHKDQLLDFMESSRKKTANGSGNG